MFNVKMYLRNKQIYQQHLSLYAHTMKYTLIELKNMKNRLVCETRFISLIWILCCHGLSNGFQYVLSF